jgi:hypothetical protein
VHACAPALYKGARPPIVLTLVQSFSFLFDSQPKSFAARNLEVKQASLFLFFFLFSRFLCFLFCSSSLQIFKNCLPDLSSFDFLVGILGFTLFLIDLVVKDCEFECFNFTDGPYKADCPQVLRWQRS